MIVRQQAAKKTTDEADDGGDGGEILSQSMLGSESTMLGKMTQQRSKRAGGKEVLLPTHKDRLKPVDELRTKLEKKIKKKAKSETGPKLRRGKTSATDVTSAFSSRTKQSTKNSIDIEGRYEIDEDQDYGYLAGAPRTFSVSVHTNPKVHSMTPTLKRLNIHDYDKKLHDDRNHKIANLRLSVKHSNNVVSRSIKTTDAKEIRRVTKLGMIRELTSIQSRNDAI